MNENKLTREERLQEREKWYSFIPALFEMAKCLKNRELAFITTNEEEKKRVIRYMWAFTIDFLKKHFEAIGFYNHLFNMYHSVAVIKGDLPYFSYNFKIRKEEEKYKEFNEKYADYVVGFNLFIDIDGKENPKEAYENTKEIKKILDERKVPYYLLNSSLTGFHVQIPQEYMPKMELESLLKLISAVMYNIKGIYDLKCLDDSVRDMKRICKLPFSFVCDGSICLPLSDYDFENFTPEKVKMKYVIKNITIKNRGLLIRTHGLQEEQLKNNVLQLLNDYKE